MNTKPDNLKKIEQTAYANALRLGKEGKKAEANLQECVFDAARSVQLAAKRVEETLKWIESRIADARHALSGNGVANDCGILQGLAGELEARNAVYCAKVQHLEQMCRLAGISAE